MAHWKFETLLSEKSLFFPNANKLSDQYEVTIPDSTLASKRRHLENNGYKGDNLEEKMAAFHWETNPIKDLVLANCWSVSQHESYALWKIYLGGEKNGVAIRSTLSSLKKAIINGGDPYPEEFYMGRIKYRAHLKYDELARLSIITTKKPFYDFEKELRVIIINNTLLDGGATPPYDISKGRSVNIDLSTLVHCIYVSPFSEPSYSRDVGSILKSSKLKAGLLKQSDIRDK
ncbi:MAG: hypothetical protein Q8O33_03690 [Pseudomonadota bacterium]|nr:hypothetical protein [Pseudomonadota bacterium]